MEWFSFWNSGIPEWNLEWSSMNFSLLFLCPESIRQHQERTLQDPGGRRERPDAHVLQPRQRGLAAQIRLVCVSAHSSSVGMHNILDDFIWLLDNFISGQACLYSHSRVRTGGHGEVGIGLER